MWAIRQPSSATQGGWYRLATRKPSRLPSRHCSRRIASGWGWRRADASNEIIRSGRSFLSTKRFIETFVPTNEYAQLDLFLCAPTDAPKMHVVLYRVIERLQCCYAEVLGTEFLTVLTDIGQVPG